MTQLKILNVLERESFKSPPVFNNIGRKKYFSLPVGLRDSFDTLRTPSNKAWFVLMYGYFKAAKRFFGTALNEKDLGFVAKQLGLERNEINLQPIQEATYRRIRDTILHHFGCSEFGEHARKNADKKDIKNST